MAYTKTVWVNLANPPVNADNLNKMETGISDAHSAAASASAAAAANASSISTVQSALTSLTSTVGGYGTRITAAEGNITTLQTSVTSLGATVSGLPAPGSVQTIGGSQAPGDVVLKLRTVSSQTGAVLQVLAPDGATVLLSISADGRLGVKHDIGTGAVGYFASDATDRSAVKMYGSAGQTADILMVANVDGTNWWSVDANGIPSWVRSSNGQNTVGAAGGASALPATPVKYLKVKYNGSSYVIPAYNA